MLNFRIMSHPLNWLTIWLMLVIAGTFGSLLMKFFSQEPATPDTAAGNLPAGISVDRSSDVFANGIFDAQIASANASLEAMLGSAEGTPIRIY